LSVPKVPRFQAPICLKPCLFILFLKIDIALLGEIISQGSYPDKIVGRSRKGLYSAVSIRRAIYLRLLREVEKMEIKKIAVNFPFSIGTIEWAPNKAEKQAAWFLYVELSTRITGVIRDGGPDQDYGSARRAMSSLYEILNITRKVIREAGPEIAHGPNSLGPIALKIVNTNIRPILDEFHSKLEAHERNLPKDEDSQKHERMWDKYIPFWDKIVELSTEMQQYLEALEEVAEVKMK